MEWGLELEPRWTAQHLRGVEARSGGAAIVSVRKRRVCFLERLLANVSTRIVLVTPGNAEEGAPFRGTSADCAWRLLARESVLAWFVTHHRSEPVDHPKMRWMPVGFGRTHDRMVRAHAKALALPVRGEEARDLPSDAVVSMPLVFNAAHTFALADAREEKALANALEFFFVCNNRALGRGDVLTRLSQADSMPGVVNHFPLSPRAYMCGALRAVFALSPGGTAPDGYRHLEFLLAGAAVVLPDHPCTRHLYQNLPVVFGEPGRRKKNATSSPPPLTCARLMEKVREWSRPDLRFEYERLTVEYWIGVIKRAAGRR